MKKMPKLLKDLFTPKEMHGLDIEDLALSLSDAQVRKVWLMEVLEEMKNLNLEVDKRLLSKEQWNITDLAIKRKAYQDILDKVQIAKRRAKTLTPQFDLDSVTVLSV